MGMTLDGYVHGADGYQDWGLGAEEDEVVAWKANSLRPAGTHVMGRRTYEEMSAFWPHQRGVYAELMNDIPKVVFSKSLATADWPETRIANGDLRDDIERLKQEGGGPIAVHGGATFVNALAQAGLIDEYRLVILPVAIGHGEALFTSLLVPMRLELVESNTFPSGTAINVYRPRRG
jgi:dihydrofolate reductase